MLLADLQIGQKVAIAASHVNKELHGLIGEVEAIIPVASFPVFVRFAEQTLHLLPQELEAAVEKVVKKFK